MYKICVYVPEKSVEKVKQALFDAGAGQMGNYDSCCWQSTGTGQFRPLQNSNPSIGTLNTTERVVEVKIELLCADERVKQAVVAIRQSHPYEEPAYDIWRLEEF
jgi:hypothetical protein